VCENTWIKHTLGECCRGRGHAPSRRVASPHSPARKDVYFLNPDSVFRWLAPPPLSSLRGAHKARWRNWNRAELTRRTAEEPRTSRTADRDEGLLRADEAVDRRVFAVRAARRNARARTEQSGSVYMPSSSDVCSTAGSIVCVCVCVFVYSPLYSR